MGPGRLTAIAVALAGIVVIGLVVAIGPWRGAATSTQISTARGQVSTVGALFNRTASGQLSNHFCTASVVDSPAGDLVITAAHCVAGLTPSQVAFVPDYAHGHRPYGVWTVSQILADQRWLSSADPNDDFAFLIVHQLDSKVAVQSITGGEALGIGESAGKTVNVAGYPDGQDGLISCENAALDFSPTQFQFDCAGYTDGTSGSPLLAQSGSSGNGDTVIGVIGGYEKGGDTASVSYAARFTSQMATLYQTALAAASR
jgi:V8-like Glu-specific endopeptidase